MRGIKNILPGITAVGLALMIPVTALGATGTKISSISLDIDSEIEAGENESEIEVETSSSKYDVEDVEVTNEPDNKWKSSDKPKIVITLEADDDYYFSPSLDEDDVSISGSDGKVTSVRLYGSNTLLVYVTLDKLEGDDDDYDLDINWIEWDESNATGSWGSADDARYYEVVLYRGDTAVATINSAYNTSYDFSDYIDQSGVYSFKVRAVYNSSNRGSYKTSDSWTVSSSNGYEKQGTTTLKSSAGTSGPGGKTQETGAWLKDSTGWWYCNADRSYTQNGWQQINDKWYYFNESGYMVTGWVEWRTQWYYCDESGAMLANTNTPDGYYVNSDGVWVK